MQCAVGPEPQYQRCMDEYVAYEIVDGVARATLRLDAVMIVSTAGTPREIDCRAVACEVTVSGWSTTGGQVTATASLPFDPDGPLAPPPVVELTPAGPYAHGQTIEVHASGLVWSADANILLCAAGSTDGTRCDWSSSRWYGLGDANISGQDIVPSWWVLLIFAIVAAALLAADAFNFELPAVVNPATWAAYLSSVTFIVTVDTA